MMAVDQRFLRGMRAADRRAAIRLDADRLEYMRQGQTEAAIEASRLANRARARARSASETLAASRVGPVACPDCSWDAHGTLEVRDRWEAYGPPIPRPGGGAAFEVVSDDEEAGSLLECPQCEAPFDPEDMAPR